MATEMKLPLTFEKDGADHIIKGKTFDWKDKIKALAGARWSPAEKAWRVPLSTNIDDFVDDVVLTQVEYEAQLKEWAKQAAEARKNYVPPYGECCKEAKIKEEYWQGPMFYLCPKHGKRPTSERGFGYTGD
jgi:hypothetical protein